MIKEENIINLITLLNKLYEISNFTSNFLVDDKFNINWHNMIRETYNDIKSHKMYHERHEKMIVR